MVRLLLAILVGLVGAAVVHIAVVFAIPKLAENNAWGRLSRIAGMYEIVRIDSRQSPLPDAPPPAEGPGVHDFAFVDPAFVTAACRFSLADGPVRLSASERTDFWSASIYSRQGDNIYSINDRSAVDSQFDLMVGTADQLVEARANSAERDETSIPVEVAIIEGYLTLRTLIDEESKRPGVDAFVRSVTCEPADIPSAATGKARDG